MKLWRRRIGLTVWTVVALLIVLLFVYVRNGLSNHFVLMEKVPIGSTVSALREIPKDDNFWGSNVVEWVDATNAQGKSFRNKYGVFTKKQRGDYQPASIASDFTGEIHIYVYRPFSDIGVIVFTFVEGRLTEKDYGYLPG